MLCVGGSSLSFSRSTDRLQRRRRRLLYCVLRPVEAASVRTRAKEEEEGGAAAAATVDTVECAQRAEANRTPCASVAPLPISPLSTFICLLLLSFCTRTNCKLRRVVDYSRISRLSSSFGPFSLRRKKKPLSLHFIWRPTTWTSNQQPPGKGKRTESNCHFNNNRP